MLVFFTADTILGASKLGFLFCQSFKYLDKKYICCLINNFTFERKTWFQQKTIEINWSRMNTMSGSYSKNCSHHSTFEKYGNPKNQIKFE